MILKPPSQKVLSTLKVDAQQILIVSNERIKYNAKYK